MRSSYAETVGIGAAVSGGVTGVGKAGEVGEAVGGDELANEEETKEATEEAAEEDVVAVIGVRHLGGGRGKMVVNGIKCRNLEREEAGLI